MFGFYAAKGKGKRPCSLCRKARSEAWALLLLFYLLCRLVAKPDQSCHGSTVADQLTEGKAGA